MYNSLRSCENGCALQKHGRYEMKKVAIFADGWRKFFNYAWVDGCHRYITEHALDVDLYVFNSFGNFSQDKKYNMGEYNIFHLPDLSEFDGAIIDVTNIHEAETRDMLVQKIKNANIPAVSLVEEMPEMYFAGIDNYTAMGTIVEHLIQEHGCKTLNFIGGPEESIENQARLRAYKEILEKYQIPYEEDRVYCHNYEIATGEEGLWHFVNADKMADAFVCANDNIAVGVCHLAKKIGYHVPQDFLVTGFDNFDKASYFEPRITTAGFVREEIAYKGMEVLHRVWNGEKEISAAHADVTYVYQDSCGCVAENPVDRSKYIEHRIMSEDREVSMDNDMMSLKRELLECKSFQEMGRRIPAHLEKLKCDAIYLLLNHEIAHCEEYASVEREEHRWTNGYPKEMEVVMAYENGKVISDLVKPIDRIVPGQHASGEASVYVFSPLHFREQEVGYLVFKNCGYMLDSQLIFEILTVLQESMENMYHRLLLSRLNEELSTLYVMDSLTGLYNRMAYNRYAIPMFKECVENNVPLMIMFVDVDRLKYINDNFGHDMGNVAIKTVAMATAAKVPENGIVIRYGGDEFVVMAPGVSAEEADSLIEQIEEHVASMSHALATGFEITTSIGYVMAKKDGRDLAEYINLADEKMYETKRKHHELQGKKK